MSLLFYKKTTFRDLNSNGPESTDRFGEYCDLNNIEHPMHGKRRSFHLLSSLILFSNVLQFLLCKISTFLFKCVPGYVILLMLLYRELFLILLFMFFIDGVQQYIGFCALSSTTLLNILLYIDMNVNDYEYNHIYCVYQYKLKQAFFSCSWS